MTQHSDKKGKSARTEKAPKTYREEKVGRGEKPKIPPPIDPRERKK